MALSLGVLISACGPAVAPKQTAVDEDLGPRNAQATEAAPVETAARPEAPVGNGTRTGTIERAKLVAVLDGGPGAFLRQLEVTPRMDGNRFIGFTTRF